MLITLSEASVVRSSIYNTPVEVWKARDFKQVVEETWGRLGLSLDRVHATLVRFATVAASHEDIALATLPHRILIDVVKPVLRFLHGTADRSILVVAFLGFVIGA